jgi:hypothetical protein
MKDTFEFNHQTVPVFSIEEVFVGVEIAHYHNLVQDFDVSNLVVNH